MPMPNINEALFVSPNVHDMFDIFREWLMRWTLIVAKMKETTIYYQCRSASNLANRGQF